MSKHIFSAAILAVLFSLAGACAQFDADSADGDDEGAAIEWPTSNAERIWVDGRSVVAGSGESPDQAAGACACTTAECFDNWVVDAFGCDVCVTFVCDGAPVAHSCSACDQDSLRPSDEWNGDGRVE